MRRVRYFHNSDQPVMDRLIHCAAVQRVTRVRNICMEKKFARSGSRVWATTRTKISSEPLLQKCVHLGSNPLCPVCGWIAVLTCEVDCDEFIDDLLELFACRRD